MRFPRHDYTRQGDFQRRDLCFSRTVRTIVRHNGDIHPLTGLPTQLWLNPWFKSDFFEMAVSMAQRDYELPCIHSVPIVIRTDDDTTPDIVWIVPPGAGTLAYDGLKNRWGDNTQAYVQPLPDGGMARWLTWSGENGGDPSAESWCGLWRIEYPDGRIVRPESCRWIYEDKLSSQRPYLLAEQGSNGRIVNIPGIGNRWVDGGDRVYAMPDQGGIRACQVSMRTGYTGRDEKTGLRQGWIGEPSYTLVNDDLAQLVARSRLSVDQIMGLRPSQVVSLYWDMGQWYYESVERLDCQYDLPDYIHGSAKGYVPYYLDVMTRQRLWAFRQDVVRVKLNDGSTAPGIMDWSVWPPVDGMIGVRKACKFDKWDVVAQVIGGLATIALPTSWVSTLFSMGLDALKSIPELIDGQKKFAAQLKAMEDGQKLVSKVVDTTTGAAKIVAEDPPSPEQKALQDRAAGLPTSTVTSPGAGSAGLAIAAAIAAAIALS